MTIKEVDESRLLVSKSLKPERKSNLGQYFTPMPIACYMASLFKKIEGKIELLDAGAGIGSLMSAFLHRIITENNDARQNLEVTAFEIDANLTPHLLKTLSSISKNYSEVLTEFSFNIKSEDFILYYSKKSPTPHFTHVILNPPYKKIQSDSIHRLALRTLDIETVNLYTGFLALALQLLREKGELVAIIPRSFCNGPYYLPFRKFLLRTAAITHIHLFKSRSEAFGQDDVLQENIIIHLVKGVKQGNVTISNSTDSTFKDIVEFKSSFSRIVKRGDRNLFIHIPEPTKERLTLLNGVNHNLKDLGLSVSTGPVVDFRLKENLRAEPSSHSVPLFYPIHFGEKEMNFPIRSKKPNAILHNEETKKWLTKKGFYTVTKRFSSKEEKQRIVARVINPDNFSSEYFGIENHLNFFHANKESLDKHLAYGLAAYLNSTFVDNYFRAFSGHTQVNASDLKQLVYPSLEVLYKLGKWVHKQRSFCSKEIDAQLTKLTT